MVLLLLLVLCLPPLALFRGGRDLALVGLLLAVPALAWAPAVAVAAALATGLAWGLLLGELARRLPLAWLAGAWLLLVLLPLWLPPVVASLRPGAAPPPAAWALWPAAPLAGESWDPARRPPLYATWGSRTPLPAVPPFFPAGVLALTAGALYWRRRSRDRSRRPLEPRA